MKVSFQGEEKQRLVSQTEKIMQKIPHKNVTMDLSIPADEYDKTKQGLKKLTGSGYFNYWKTVLGRFF